MSEPANHLTIGAFAKAAGVSVETVRFYQRRGLLREPEKPYGGIRRYGKADVARVKFIKLTQRLGFRLDEVAQLLQLESGMNCAEVADIAGHRLADVRSRLADLARMEKVLSDLVSQCHRSTGDVSCPLIKALQEAEGLSDL